MPFAFDGASAFDLDKAKAHGGIVATVYIVGTPGGFPHADKARVDAIRAAGMGAYPNWERAADFFSHATAADAKRAGVEALQACMSLGFPADGSIDVAFSFDFDIAPARYGEMAKKLAACNEGLAGLYRAVAYGPSGFIEYLGKHGQPGPHWLMMSTFNRQPYRIDSPYVAMVQQHKATGEWLDPPFGGVDINTITQPDKLGAWWPDNHPTPQEDDMPLTDADVAKIWAHPHKSGDVTHTMEQWTVLGAKNALKAAIVSALPTTDGLTQTQVEDAIEAGMRKVFADAGTP